MESARVGRFRQGQSSKEGDGPTARKSSEEEVKETKEAKVGGVWKGLK